MGSIARESCREGGLRPDSDPAARQTGPPRPGHPHRPSDAREQRRTRRGRSQFKTDIAAKLSATQTYSLAHGLLASLPSKEAVTTNFDVLFEQACKIADADIAVLPENPRATEGRWLLKLHGGVDDPERMVLTRSDYLEMPRRYGALMGLVQGLLMLRKMVFIGYSLSDEDFHELVDEVRSARAGATEIVRGTVLSLAEDPLHKQLWGTM